MIVKGKVASQYAGEKDASLEALVTRAEALTRARFVQQKAFGDIKEDLDNRSSIVQYNMQKYQHNQITRDAMKNFFYFFMTKGKKEWNKYQQKQYSEAQNTETATADNFNLMKLLDFESMMGGGNYA